MSCKEKSLAKGEVYKNFEVLSVESLPELLSEGIWLRHRENGMEIFHLLNDDEENLFAFAFKTPPENSTGVAHILEHSVLCGSKNYPLKAPFIQLANQSVKTFLNAMTFSDKTVYPAASISKQDYFNLMAVYGDAVFFPLLEEWTFTQEGHRLELDAQGNPVIQGVVYNEMKGNYSSFEAVAGDFATRSVLPNTVYDLDSGGDPIEIPLLTYKKFVKFHREHYNPSNCRLFLAGNIPTQEQIDFITEKFLDPYQETVAFLNAKVNEAMEDAEDKTVGRELLPLERPPVPFNEPIILEKIGPGSNGDENPQEKSGATVTLTWFMGDSSDPLQYMETVLLAEILMGHDGSPLSHALLDSGLGEDLAPNCGLDSEMHWVLLTVGLRGCQKNKASEVEELVLSVLEKLHKEGVSKEDIEAAVLSVDFSQREVRRVFGPYSLILMRRCLRGWLYGKSPFATISNRRAFEKIKERIGQEPNYVANLIEKLLLNNKHRSRVTVYPHSDYATQRQMKEKELAQKLLVATSLEGVRAKHEKLVEFQQKSTDKEDASILPHISPQDLPVEVDEILVQRETGPNQVPVFVSQEATNGVVYAQLCFPVDLLEPEEYPLLPFLSGSIANVGFGSTSWVEAARRSALEVGGIGASLFTSSMMNGMEGRKGYSITGEVTEDPIFGRDWLFLKVKMLSEQSSKAMNLIKDILLTVDFSDTERLSNLIKEYRNDFVASLAPNGNEYTSTRCGCTLSRNKAVDEIWSGLSQLATVKKLVDSDMEELGKKLASILVKIKSFGAIAHITADKESLDVALPLIKNLIEDCNLMPPQAPGEDRKEEFIALTQLPYEQVAGLSDNPSEVSVFEIMPGDFQVGFAATACCGKGYENSNYVYQGLLTHWITNTSLWEQIRTVGGAYGAFAWADVSERVFAFATYRDPKPLRSLQVFQQIMVQATETLIDEEALEKVITGCYSKEVQPKSPSSRGSIGFLRHIFGYSQEEKRNKLRLLLNAKPKDIQQVAKEIVANLSENKRMAVILNSKEINVDELRDWNNVHELSIISENCR